MYQVLYNKWRPQNFDQVIGQSHVTETLKNQVRNGRLSHAYIFIGTRGTGKTTCARILARAVNCEHPVDGNPCGVCPACRGISDGSILDVVELDAASNNGVDNVRALREESLFSPTSVKKRVYIIDEVHMLSASAFNALLKILEEPPEHLMFILATTELQKVPATILSRCQRHSFRRIEAAELAGHLKYIAGQEHINLSDDAAGIIARLAEGGVRDALSLLDQCSGAELIDANAVYSAMGLAGNMRISAMLDSVLRHDSQTVLKNFTAMWMDGKDPAAFLGELSGLMRDVLMMHVAPKSGTELISGGYDLETLNSFAKRMTTEELLCALGTVQGALAGMRDVKNPKTAAELCLVSLCDNTLGDSAAELRARVSRLEEQLKRGVPAAAPVVPERYEEDVVFPAEEPDRVFPPEEELDPEAFYEEQPEDAFIKRDRPETEEQAPAAQPDMDLWKTVCDKAAPSLTMDLRVSLRDDKRVRGYQDGDVLRIEVAPGFLYNRFNKQDVLGRFAEAAREAAGRELRVQLSEMPGEGRQTRSLEELKKFSEVRFT